MFKTVKIPVFSEDKVIDVTEVEIFDRCPVCKEPRGQTTSRFLGRPESL